MPPEPPRFRDYDSTERGTLCLLYTEGGRGDYLGMVYVVDNPSRSWCWEADTATCHTEGSEPTRRAAKQALRRALKESGDL